MTLNTISDLPSFLKGRTFLNQLSPEEEKQLVQELPTKPLLDLLVQKRFGKQWIDLVHRVQDREMMDQSVNTHNLRLKSQREKTQQWLQRTVTLNVIQDDSSKVAQINELEKNLLDFVKQHNRSNDLKSYIALFVQEYQKGATGWGDLMRVVIRAKDLSVSENTSNDRVQNLISTLIEAMDAYQISRRSFYPSHSYSCASSLHERILDALSTSMPADYQKDTDLVRKYCERVLGDFVNHTERDSAWTPSKLLKSLYLEVQDMAGNVVYKGTRPIFNGWLTRNRTQESSFQQKIATWVDSKQMVKHIPLAQNLFAKFKKKEMDLLQEKFDEAIQASTDDQEQKILRQTKQIALKGIDEALTLHDCECIKSFIKERLEGPQGRKLLEKMKAPSKTDIQKARKKKILDEATSLAVYEKGTVLDEVFTFHFQGFYKEIQRPYCVVKQQSSEELVQALKMMIEFTGLSLEHFQAINILMNLNPKDSTCSELMSILAQSVEKDSTVVKNASTVLERFKEQILSWEKDIASTVTITDQIEYLVVDDNLLNLLKYRVKSDMHHRRGLPCDGSALSRVIDRFESFFTNEEKKELAGLCLELGYTDSFRELFNKYPDLRKNGRYDAQYYGGARSFLCAASKLGDAEIVQMLIETGADVNFSDGHGLSPLQRAVANRRIDVIQLLICAGADLNQSDRYGYVPLLCAVETGQAAIVQILIDSDHIDPNKSDTMGITPLHLAVSKGNSDVTQILIASDLIDVNQVNTMGQTPLHLGAINGSSAIVEMLLEKGAYMNKVDSFGQSPLYYAAIEGHSAVVKLLIDAVGPMFVDQLIGAEDDVNHSNPFGQTPLYWAAINGRAQAVKTLIDKGAKINQADEDGRTPLYWSVHHGYKDIVAMLIGENGVDVNQADEDGRTPLYWAAHHGYKDIVAMLIGTNSVDVNQADEDGRTPLYWAAHHGYKDIVAMLIGTNSVDLNQADEDGRTPLYWAVYYGYKDIFAMLIASPGINHSAQTPLYWALKNGHKEVVNALIEHGSYDLKTILSLGGVSLKQRLGVIYNLVKLFLNKVCKALKGYFNHTSKRHVHINHCINNPGYIKVPVNLTSTFKTNQIKNQDNKATPPRMRG